MWSSELAIDLWDKSLMSAVMGAIGVMRGQQVENSGRGGIAFGFRFVALSPT